MHTKKNIAIFSLLFLVSCGQQAPRISVEPISTESVKETTFSGEIGSVKDIDTPIMSIENIDNPSLESETINIPDNKIENQNCIVFDDFSDELKNNWIIVNDGVMGGLSQGKYITDNETLTFSGNINTNGGGFSSIRARMDTGLLEKATHIHILAKVDARKYEITFRDSNTRGISYQASLPFQNTGGFEDITLPISSLKPTYFGRSANAPDFQKDSASEIGFILSDGIDGPFQLEIQKIEFCEE